MPCRDDLKSCASTMLQILKAASLLITFGLLHVQNAEAQHSIDVQRQAANAQYFDSLLSFERMPKRKADSEARIAAGKSAWALGLPERASLEFETALKDAQLDNTKRARLNLSRALIEYQEQRPKVAQLYAQRAIDQIKQPGPLRARANLLMAQIHSDARAYGAAEMRLISVVQEAKLDDMPEAHFRLGECQMRLGKLEEARQSFEQVPLAHDLAPEALRNLAQLALDGGDFNRAEFWLSKGREEYPNSFLDSWVDYALLQIAISQADAEKVEAVSKNATEKFAPSDFWLNLLDAAAEAYLWRATQLQEM